MKALLNSTTVFLFAPTNFPLGSLLVFIVFSDAALEVLNQTFSVAALMEKMIVKWSLWMPYLSITNTCLLYHKIK